MEETKDEGHLHPVTIMKRQVLEYFVENGFEIVTGPEVETEYYNFDALNVPKDHPARDMQDTFWLEGEPGTLLATHTSPVQARYMESHEPPFRIVVPGKVFRNEATDATHETQFHQIEVLVVGKGIALANLKHSLEGFLKHLYGETAKMKLRPGYFPFVEPGVEIDMECMRCSGKGCPSCKYNGWIEILGAGMVHPKVLENAGIDSHTWSGFAIGVGVDRLLMLRYGIEDIRLLYSGNLRVVDQF